MLNDCHCNALLHLPLYTLHCWHFLIHRFQSQAENYTDKSTSSWVIILRMVHLHRLYLAAHFQVVLCLCLKASPGAQPVIGIRPSVRDNGTALLSLTTARVTEEADLRSEVSVALHANMGGWLASPVFPLLSFLDCHRPPVLLCDSHGPAPGWAVICPLLPSVNSELTQRRRCFGQRRGREKNDAMPMRAYET